MLPREHGAWAMFLVPLFVGLGVTGQLDGKAIPFSLATLFIYLARHPLTLLVKGRKRRGAWTWLGIYLLLALAFGLPLLVFYRLWLLLPLAGLAGLLLALYLYQAARRAEMSTRGEFLGIAGLTLSAPGAYYVTSGALDGTALFLWLANVLYFGGTVFYIKLKVREQPRRPAPADPWGRLVQGKATVLYHLFVVGFLLTLARFGWVPSLVPLAFAPCLAKALRGVLAWGGRPHMMKLGLTEVAHSVTFGLLLILAYRFI